MILSISTCGFFWDVLIYRFVFYFVIIDKTFEEACDGAIATKTSKNHKIVIEEIRHSLSKDYCWDSDWWCF